MKPLLGGKGANLAEMTRIGLPVPPGFTITTEVCTYYYANKKTYPPSCRPRWRPAWPTWRRSWAQVRRRQGHAAARGRALRRPRLDAGHDGHDPQPRPQRQTVQGARSPRPSNERFAWDCYRRFIQMYGDVVLGVQKREGEDHEPFETVIHDFKHERTRDIVETELTADDQKELVKRFKALVKERTGKASRTIRGSSSGAPPAPCSVPG
jgi:pyruvate, orthophosphate dikinase